MDATQSSELDAPAVAPDDDALPPGTTAGRYVLLERVGAGAMGVVYAAYDVGLHRKVAIKLVRMAPDAARAERRSERLGAEARTLAKLAHPNVVSVFDVGTLHDQVFVAMEWLGGGTVRSWLDGGARRVDEIVTCYLAVGEGLDAAHRAGIVHRDLKPDNLMLGDDGRVRVTDFGLARPDDQRVPDAVAAVAVVDSPRVVRTREGFVLGTPAYMAPEQLHGEPATAASDQFSFCVSLYESLYGRRPEAGARVVPLAIGRGGQRIPATVRAVVARGLSPVAAERYATMAELVRALGQRPRRRAAVALGLAVAVLAIAVAGFSWSRQAPAPPLCLATAEQLVGLWDPPRRAAIEAAFVATGKRGAAGDFRALAGELDRYAHDWAAARTASCEATLVRHDQSPALFDLQMQCLADRRVELDALAEALAHIDGPSVDRAPQQVSGLASIADCTRTDLTSRHAPRHLTPIAAAERDRNEQQFARIDALELIGHDAEVIAGAEQVRAWAAGAHDRDLEARALFLIGAADRHISRDDESIAALEAAYAAADAGGDDAVRIKAALTAMLEAAERNHDAAAAARWRHAAEVALERLGPHDAAVDSSYWRAVALVAQTEGRHEDALAASQRDLDAQDQRGVDDEELYKALDTRVYIIVEAQAGGAAAEPLARRQLALATKLFGADSPALMSSYDHVCAIELFEQHWDAAIAACTKSHGFAEQDLGADSREALTDLANLAVAYASKGDYARARATTQQAIDGFDRMGGRGAVDAAMMRVDLAATLTFQGDSADALRELTASTATLARMLGTDHPDYVRALGERGKVLVDLGRTDEARAALEPVLAHDAIHHDQVNLPELRFALARALWPHPDQRVRARALLAQATAEATPARAHDIEVWLAAAAHSAPAN